MRVASLCGSHYLCGMRSLKIVFMGTPEFAVASLEALVQSTHEVVAVITAPDRKAGRGRKLTASAVKTYALAHELPVLQPTNLKHAAFQDELRSYGADLFVVVAFRMLPQSVWEMPPLGTFNLHASLLPDYRGAAPINWAVINGETETGITTFLLDKQIDTGALLLQERVPIPRHYSAGDLHDDLMTKGAQLVATTADRLASGDYSPQPQPAPNTGKLAPKIFRDDRRIDWQRPAEALYHFIRGLSPYPGAWTTLDGETFKVVFAEVASPPIIIQGVAPGQIVVEGEELFAQTGDGWLRLTHIQPAGKRRMATADWLRGMDGEGLGAFE